MLNHEKLKCLATQEEITDDGLVLDNPASGRPALMRALYRNESLAVKEGHPGIFRFSDWLPINRILESSGYPVTYKSERLARKLDLKNLYITFSGYWPQKDANLTTGTFKECEAYPVCARMPQDTGKVLVVASAGNTARAFMKVASDNNIPVAIVVPEKNVKNLWTLEKLNPCVRIIAAGGDSDYFDAIKLAGILCQTGSFISEGGAKNVARRDGMGTTVLSCVTTMGEIPDYYFQAVGSGTGVIAAYEANDRFIRSKKYGNKKMRLIASQNVPFTPMVNAWQKNSRTLEAMDEREAFMQIEEVDAKVLSNRQPPYGITGGLFDVLKDSDGDMVPVNNQELRQAQALFLDTEGQDIGPEAGVALASLIKKIEDHSVERDATLMLNVTGGGMQALFREKGMIQAIPDVIINKDAFDVQSVKMKVSHLFTDIE